MQQSLDTMAAQARVDLGGEPRAIGATGDDPPRFELFHGANSICSQKVRAVLAHHGIPHVARTVNMFTGQTYLPSYVRLRMVGCDRIGTDLASVHTGSTSVSAGGCDGAVVPTLIDWDTREVIVDSLRICHYLDDLQPESARLRPPALVEAIAAEIAVVDNLPNYQMLAGQPPGATQTPMSRAGKSGPGFSLSKVARCDAYLAEFAGDDALTRAYTAKRAKELHAANRLFSPEAMTTAYAAAEAACEAFDRRLREGGTPWLFGDQFMLADLFWAVELMRLKNIGASVFWEEGRLPALASFAATAEHLPAIRAAILDWPGAMF